MVVLSDGGDGRSYASTEKLAGRVNGVLGGRDSFVSQVELKKLIAKLISRIQSAIFSNNQTHSV